jgi:hypothetical protein
MTRLSVDATLYGIQMKEKIKGRGAFSKRDNYTLKWSGNICQRLESRH